MWHGCIVLSLNDLPKLPNLGWTLGYGPIKLADEGGSSQADIFLSIGPRSRSLHLHRQSAALNFTSQLAVVGAMAARSDSELQVEKRVIPRDRTYHALFPGNILSVGDLDFRCVYTVRSTREDEFLRHRQAHLVSVGKPDPLPSAASTPSDQDWIISGWRLFKTAGTGSSGTVTAAMYEQTSVAGAVKAFRKPAELQHAAQVLREIQSRLEGVQYADNVQTFRTELVHPSGDMRFIVTTPFAMRDLGDLIRTWHAAPSPPVDVSYRRIAVQILQGVAALHQASILHHDVKPANIGVVSLSKLHVVLLDLDGARLLSSPDEQLPAGVSGGTIGFLAPERERVREENDSESDDEKRVYGLPSDVWSVGCVLLKLFFNVHFTSRFNPFRGVSDLRKNYPKITAGEIKTERSRYYEIAEQLETSSPDSIESLVGHLLRDEPERRPTAKAALKHPSFRRTIAAAKEELSQVGSKRSAKDDVLRSQTSKQMQPGTHDAKTPSKTEEWATEEMEERRRGV